MALDRHTIYFQPFGVAPLEAFHITGESRLINIVRVFSVCYQPLKGRTKRRLPKSTAIQCYSREILRGTTQKQTQLHGNLCDHHCWRLSPGSKIGLIAELDQSVVSQFM